MDPLKPDVPITWLETGNDTSKPQVTAAELTEILKSFDRSDVRESPFCAKISPFYNLFQLQSSKGFIYPVTSAAADSLQSVSPDCTF